MEKASFWWLITFYWGWPHLKCLLNSFRSAFDNNDHFVLLTQLWFLAGTETIAWVGQIHNRLLRRSGKNYALILSLYKFSWYKKPSESDTSIPWASKNCPALGILWNQATFIGRCLLKGWSMVSHTACQAASLGNKSSSLVALPNLCHGLHCPSTKV